MDAVTIGEVKDLSRDVIERFHEPGRDEDELHWETSRAAITNQPSGTKHDLQDNL